MVAPVRIQFAQLCRDTRLMMDVTQGELAAAVGVSRPYIASIESAHANPSLRVVERIIAALGLEIDLVARPPIVFNSPHQRDIVHARCSGYVDRRLMAQGWLTRREVTIVRGRMRGWIDLLAYDPRRRVLIVIEIKTWVDDLGAIERQLDWYTREVPFVARDFGWRSTRTVGWLLLLASSDVDDAIQRNRDAFAAGFADRARLMRSFLSDQGTLIGSRGVALIDPRNRRREWLVPSRADGRRSAAPYRDFTEARRLMSA